MISRQQGVMIGVGAVLGIACAVVGFSLVSAFMKNQAKETQLKQAKDTLDRLYQEKIFPNDENIAQIHKDREALGAWLESATNRLARGEIPAEDLTPSQFKEDLVKDIRKMALLLTTQGVERVAADFWFGFDRYKEAVMPAADDVPRLSQQFSMIKLIVRELCEAKIIRLEVVEREVFEGGDGQPKAAESSVGSRRNKPKPPAGGGVVSGGGAQPAAVNPALAELLDCQRFTVVFLATPDTLASVMNSLSAIDMYSVVSDVDIRKTGESLARTDQDKKKDAAAKPEEKPFDPTAVPVLQVITNPPSDPPVRVRLNVDVYSFKGV